MTRFWKNIILLLPLTAALQATSVKTSVSKPDFQGWTFQGTRFVSGHVELAPVPAPQAEVSLDFESKNAAEIHDSSNHYRIRSSSYLPDKKYYHSGNYSARFGGKHSSIVLDASPNQMLGSSEILEPFTISFFIRPAANNRNGILFTKVYPYGGQSYGMTGSLQSGKFRFQLLHMFRLEDNSSESLELTIPSRLSLQNWNEIRILVDPVEKEIVAYLDGNEEIRKRLPDNLQIVSFGFHPLDTTGFHLGENFFGWMDDFQILRGAILPQNSDNDNRLFDAETQRFHNRKGRLTSPVLKTKHSSALPLALNWKTSKDSQTDSLIQAFVRISEDKFRPDDPEPHWMDYRTFREVSEAQNSPFHYYQIRFVILENSDTFTFPSLISYNFHYLDNLPPVKPTGFQVEQFDPRKLEVCLQWRQNPEANVQKGGGYIVYFGPRQNRMVASIKIDKNGNPIQLQNATKVSFCLNNAIISKNAGEKDSKILPVLQPGTTYHFRISAYNSRYYRSADDPTGSNRPDQESPLSNSINVTFYQNAE